MSENSNLNLKYIIQNSDIYKFEGSQFNFDVFIFKDLSKYKKGTFPIKISLDNKFNFKYYNKFIIADIYPYSNKTMVNLDDLYRKSIKYSSDPDLFPNESNVIDYVYKLLKGYGVDTINCYFELLQNDIVEIPIDININAFGKYTNIIYHGDIIKKNKSNFNREDKIDYISLKLNCYEFQEKRFINLGEYQKSLLNNPNERNKTILEEIDCIKEYINDEDLEKYWIEI